MMLTWVLIFFIVAIVAGILGFTDIAAEAVGIARIIFSIFIVLFIASLLFHLFR